MRRADIHDLPAIVALDEAGFDAGRWSSAAWRAELEDPFKAVFVSTSDAGDLIGVIAVAVLFETADLLRVIVAAPVRRHGLGRALVAAGVEWAAGQGADRMLLEVSADNGPALRLYQQLGFTAIHERPDYYGQGDNALIMECSLSRSGLEVTCPNR
jgi:ribosomal-protein-alanine N-acetyltransferase